MIILYYIIPNNYIKSIKSEKVEFQAWFLQKTRSRFKCGQRFYLFELSQNMRCVIESVLTRFILEQGKTHCHKSHNFGAKSRMDIDTWDIVCCTNDLYKSS